jgi:hypothetical protein
MDCDSWPPLIGILDRGHGPASGVSRTGRASARVIDALDALCRGESGALARLKVATQAYVAELSDRALPRDSAIDGVTDLIAACWSQGAVPAPAPLVREALVDVVGSWCADELARIARGNARTDGPSIRLKKRDSVHLSRWPSGRAFISRHRNGR